LDFVQDRIGLALGLIIGQVDTLDPFGSQAVEDAVAVFGL